MFRSKIESKICLWDEISSTEKYKYEITEFLIYLIFLEFNVSIDEN